MVRSRWSRLAALGFICTASHFSFENSVCGFADWTRFRGPNGSGVAEDKEPTPTTWSENENLKWKVPLPGAGVSCPIVVGNQVFVTCYSGYGINVEEPGDVKNLVRHLVCVDRGTGKILWQKSAHSGKVFDNRHKAGSYAAPTPLTDGRNIYAYFGSEGLHAFDYDGKLLWKFDPGPIKTIGMGPGTSPVMDADRIFLQCDNGEENKSYVVALDKKTGKTLWRVERPVNLTWSTPLFFDGALVTAATEKVIAYDPKTGKQLWEAPGVKGNSVPSPVSGDGVVVVSAGYPEKFASAFGPGGKALWSYAKGTAYVPSPIFYGAYVYLITDKGLLTCIDSKTGEVKYEGKRPPVPATFAGSPVAYDGKILITSEDGDSFVIKAGPEHIVLHSNSIGEPVLSSPALSNGMLFLRGKDHLFAIAAL